MSKFVVANGMIAEVKAAFRNRPHLVDGAPGYLRMEVISPLERPEEIWLITFWADEGSFRTWHRSHLYQRAVTSGLTHRNVLLRYAIWMLAAAGCAVGAAISSGAVVVVLGLAMLAALGLVWRWVVTRERVTAS